MPAKPNTLTAPLTPATEPPSEGSTETDTPAGRDTEDSGPVPVRVRTEAMTLEEVEAVVGPLPADVERLVLERRTSLPSTGAAAAASAPTAQRPTTRPPSLMDDRDRARAARAATAPPAVMAAAVRPAASKKTGGGRRGG